MVYTTPVYDRTIADVLAENSKAYINITDWARIYANADAVNDLFTAVGISITFNTLSQPATSDIPTNSDINTLLGNIEAMRLWIATYASDRITDPLFVEIKDDWSNGVSADAPDYTHANSWEKVLDLMYNEVSNWTKGDRQAVCGIAVCGSGLTRQNSWRD